MGDSETVHAYLIIVGIDLQDIPFFIRNFDMLTDRNSGRWFSTRDRFYSGYFFSMPIPARDVFKVLKHMMFCENAELYFIAGDIQESWVGL